MGRFLKSFKVFILSLCLFQSSLFAQTRKSAQSAENNSLNPQYNIRELALPSEVNDVSKKVGSIYYSPSVKGKVLIPVHFWGEVKNSGLHFVPLDTSLVNGLSLAGGPTNQGVLENVIVNTTREGERRQLHFDVSKGGDLSLEKFKLQPGDTIFIEKDNYRADRAYYTSLFGVILTVLSSILLYRQVKSN